MDNGGSRNFFAGFLVGAVIGLAIGFLYAPQRGEETRQLLKDGAEIAEAKLAELAQKAKEAVAKAKELA